MKNNNAVLFRCLCCIAGIGIYSLCVFVLINEYSKRFWVSYTFTIIAFLIQAIIPLLLYLDRGVEKDRFLEIPFCISSSIYLGIQMIVGIVFMIIPISVKYVLITEVVILACFVFVTIMLKAWREAAVESDIRIEETTEFIKNMTVRTKNLYEEEADLEKKAKLKRMWEAIRYSDPVSKDESVYSINKEIEKAVDIVGFDLGIKTVEELSQEVKMVIDLANKRNYICKKNK